MAFLSSTSTTELQHYHEVVARSTQIRSHFDLLSWLQGDIQAYLPHDILIASWGDFRNANLLFDVISPLPGVRSRNIDAAALGKVVTALHGRWTEFGQQPFAVNSGLGGFLPDTSVPQDPIGSALARMRCVLVHGIVDSRGNHDCLYAVFKEHSTFKERERSAFSLVLPYIDTALRQIQHLPAKSPNDDEKHAAQQQNHVDHDEVSSMINDRVLSGRESQILHWVAMGKTNPEIASILHISSFTVKNHMQRVFKKLDVKNRAQAVSKYRSDSNHVQD